MMKKELFMFHVATIKGKSSEVIIAGAHTTQSTKAKVLSMTPLALPPY